MTLLVVVCVVAMAILAACLLCTVIIIQHLLAHFESLDKRTARLEMKNPTVVSDGWWADYSEASKAIKR